MAFMCSFFSIFAVAMLELNDVLLQGEHHTLSLMAAEGRLTCIVDGSRWLQAMLGFEPIVAGFISIDGEPLTAQNAASMRRMMAFVPHSLDDMGSITVYKAPTAAEVLGLRANHGCLADIHADRTTLADALQQEQALTGLTGQQSQLLALAVLLHRPILLVDRPAPSALPYLHRQAEAGSIVIVATTDETIIGEADTVVEQINE